MKTSLNELVDRFPPPAKPRFTPVDWDNLERSLGFSYPPSFQEFIDVYGGSVWFNNLSPLYSQAQTDEEAREFLKTVDQKCNQDRGNTYDEHGKPFSPPFYPDEGGLFPFLVDYGGNEYYWETDADDPEEWPIVKSHGGWMTRHTPMSIPAMILKWLERDPQMMEMWGDVSRVPPEQLRITEV